jgi:hypothetical protein
VYYPRCKEVCQFCLWYNPRFFFHCSPRVSQKTQCWLQQAFCLTFFFFHSFPWCPPGYHYNKTFKKKLGPAFMLTLFRNNLNGFWDFYHGTKAGAGSPITGLSRVSGDIASPHSFRAGGLKSYPPSTGSARLVGITWLWR